MKKEQTTTDKLDELLLSASASDAEQFLTENADKLAQGPNDFGDFFRNMAKARELRLQDIFIAAEVPERYGYKLISGEKHTRQRDVILRLCFAAGLGLSETQRALKLYGMPPLYSRVPRDAMLTIAVNTGIRDTDEVDELLTGHGMEPLAKCGEEAKDTPQA